MYNILVSVYYPFILNKHTYMKALTSSPILSITWLSSLTILAGVLLAPALVQAQSGTAIWSATLTVNAAVNGCFDSSFSSLASRACPDALSSDTFELDGATYTVFRVQNEGGNLVLGIQPNLPEAFNTLTLTVDGQEIDFSVIGGALNTANPFSTVEGSTTIPLWTQGQEVTLSLSPGSDTTPPTVSISDVPAGSDAPFTATITFSEEVTGFTQSDITPTNAQLSEFTQTVTGTTWTVLVTPDSDGTVTLTIPAGVATDGANNDNTAASPVSSTYTAPALPPGVEVWSGTLHVQELPDSQLGVQFGCENSASSSRCSDGSVLSDDDFTYDGVEYDVDLISIESITFLDLNILNFQFSPALPAGWDQPGLTFTVDGQAAKLTRQDGNDPDTSEVVSNFAKTDIDFTWTVGQEVEVKLFYNNDVTAPVVTISDVPGTSTAPFTATITFSEEVTGFTETDITTTNAQLSEFTETVTGTTWTVLVTPDSDGTVTLTIPAGVATDGANNDNTAATPVSSTYTAPVIPPPDTTAPTVEISGIPAVSTGPFTATITFSEEVTGFTETDITTTTNVRLSAFREQTTGTVYEVVVTPTETGPLTLDIAAGVATDGAGNDNRAASQVSSLYTAPETPAGVEVWSGTLNVQQLNSSTVGCSNSNSSASCSDSSILSDDEFTYDGVEYDITLLNRLTIPRVLDRFQLRVDPNLPAHWDETTVAVTVDGRVLAVDRTDVEDVNTGELTTQFGTSGPGFTWTPGQEVEVKLFYNDVTPPDTTPPTVSISDVPAGSDAPFTATITFSEEVTGFTETDITITNAQLSEFTETVTGTTWTVLVTPDSDGTVTLTIPAGVATDGANNDNTAASPVSSTYTAPALPPGVEVWSATLTVADAVSSSGCTNSVNSARCSSSSRLTDDDFELGGVTYTVREVLIGQFGQFDFEFSPALADGIDAENLTITVDGQEVDVTIYDNRLGFSNLSPGFTWTAGQTVALGLFNADTTAPTVTITGVPAASDGPFTATITFSEAVTGFDQGDIAVSPNADLSDFTETTPDTVWTVKVTPTANGDVTLAVPARAARDLADNPNTLATPRTSTYTAPITTSSDSAIWSATLTVDLNSNGCQSVFSSGGGAEECRNALTPNTFELDGDTYTVDVVANNAGALTLTISPALPDDFNTLTLTVDGEDLAFSVASGNDPVTGDTFSFVDATETISPWTQGQEVTLLLSEAGGTTTPPTPDPDTTSPTVTISDVPATSTGPFTATLTFDETVTGFTESDISAENATLSEFTETATGTTWTVLVTPSAAGTVTLTIPASAATDAADNSNAFVSATSTYVLPIPDIQITGLDGVLVVDGATSPSPANGSAFGAVPSLTPAGLDNPFTRTFTITNTGTGDLNLSRDVRIVQETSRPNVNWRWFSISRQPDKNIAPGESTTFDITFNATRGGNQISAIARVSIRNNDPDEQPFTFQVGAQSSAPFLDLEVDGTALVNDGTLDFGELDESEESKDQVITIENGISNIFADTMYFDADSITITGPNADEFSIVQQPTGPVAPGETTTFTLRYTPQNSGPAEAEVDVNPTNSSSKSFTVTGRTVPPEISVVAGPSPVEEGTAASFTLTRTGPNDDSLEVAYTLSGTGEVLASEFQLGESYTFSFLAGESSHTLTLLTEDDDLDESDGEVTLTLSPEASTPPRYTLGTSLEASVSVTDNDEADTIKPTVTISGVPQESDGPFTATIEFSEAVTGFAITDITAGKATLSDLTETATGTTWTVRVSPTEEGEVTLDISADVVADTAGNGNEVATQVSSTYTPPPPSVTLVSNTGQNLDAGGSSSQYRAQRFTTGSNSAGYVLTSVDVIAGSSRVAFAVSVCEVTPEGPPRLSTCRELSPPSSFPEGRTTFTASSKLELEPDTTYTVLTDPAGSLVLSRTRSDNEDAGGALGWSLAGGYEYQVVGSSAWQSEVLALPVALKGYALPDTVSPTVDISDVPASTEAPFTATITFSEFVTGFEEGDISVTNASLSDFTVVTAGREWTVLVTPLTEGEVTLDIAAGLATDEAGNTNEAAPQASSAYTTPTTVPITTLVSNVGQSGAGSLSSVGSLQAQRFTTGDNPGGYLLARVGVFSNDAGGRGFDLSVCELASNGRDPVSSTCVALDPPSSFTGGRTLTFTASPPIQLESDTTYTIVVRPTGNGVVFGSVSSDGEDAGTAPGWSLADESNSNANNGNGPWQSYVGSLRVTLEGYIPPEATTFVTNTSVSSSAPRYRPDTSARNARDIYGEGDVIEFTVSFSDSVEVDTTNGTPHLVFSLGGTRVNAPYLRGSGTNELVFGYTCPGGG